MRFLNAALAFAAVALAKSDSPGISLISTASSGAFAYTIGNDTYYAPATSFKTGCSSSGLEDTLPMTILKTDEKLVTADILASTVDQYAELDDVWTPDFLGGALALSLSPEATLDETIVPWLRKIGITHLLLKNGTDTSSLTSSGINVFLVSESWIAQPGPYTLVFHDSTIAVHQTYRLHRDNQEAFLFGTTPVADTTAYEAVDLFISSYQDAWIPVPSRLHSLGDDRPLAGIRIGLKDIYDLKGVQTGGGSRSYAEVFPVADASAVSVQKLIDLGAVIIGKTKTSQFAHGADPWQFIDIHYPWNPRGDGYLTAASSSSGSAAAIAAYEWMDIALGSDTRGSVRKPAAVVGSYGIRPTWKSMDLTGVIPLANEMDTAGFFARDPQLFHKISKLWYEDAPIAVNKTFSSWPKKLMYPVDYFPLQNAAAQDLFDSFIEVLEDEFGMKRTPFNFTKTLNEAVTNPEITNITNFQLNSNRLAEYISYTEVGVPLAEAWNERFPGRGYPPLDPNPRAAFQRSMNLTDSDYEASVSVKNEFRDFFLKEVLRPDSETCSDGIMILDMGTGGLPSYREQALNSMPNATFLTVTSPGGGPTVPSNYLASMAGCPQVGMPVGQVSYQSYISMQEEKPPVNVDLVAAPGCDGLLLDILEKLASKGVVKTVKAGRVAF